MSPQATSMTVEADAARYVIEARLGEGAAGAVYLAKDLETGEQVALKKLFRMDPKTVLRLKREFRALVDINHQHIVKLYDMGRASDGWFFTMEYLRGEDLSRYLANEPAASGGASNDNALARLLSCFMQLALGVNALHQAGMLHRDLKPSNVFVVEQRVVVLDFGLVRELDVNAATLTEDGSISGTPAYMAPEQIAARELTAASDWYAFGIMLYEALSGHLPFDGALLDVLRRKLDTDPEPVSSLAPTAPPRLLQLCTALLQRDPKLRPGFAAIMDALMETAPSQLQVSAANLPTTEAESRESAAQLFGRHAEVSALWKALGESAEGRTVVVHVRGASGAGKSSVVEQFLDEIEETRQAPGSGETLVLRSRCYELEAMPFKALDGVIDALVHHLMHLGDVEAAHLVPSDIGALAQLFPAFERVGAIKRLLANAKPAGDALLHRQRAELALQLLLQAVAHKQPVVLWIDDLQWGDLDSARILQNWLQQPAQASLLFVFSYRSEEISTSTCLARLLEDAQSTRASEHTIAVNALGDADIRALCEARLGSSAKPHGEILERIVAEAAGSPFLASQLAALAQAKLARGDSDSSELSIRALVEQTGALLPEEAKTLLAVLAVAGRPMERKLALRAAGIERNGRALTHLLRSLNLVRTRHVAGERMLEVYHDRVRESVDTSLRDDERVALNTRLFTTLEFSGSADPDWLHALALSAGRRESALEYGRAAAERAFASLAFERAAQLLRNCIALSAEHDIGALWKRAALALGYAGQGVQAAEACLEAARHADRDQALALRHAAATHLMRCGHFERGEELLDQVLIEAGIHVPKSDGGLIAAIAWERLRFKLRRHDWQPGTALAAPEQLALHDIYDALGISVQQHTPLRAMLFYHRALRAALAGGEPRRIGRALAMVAAVVSYSGRPSAERESDALLARAEKVLRDANVWDPIKLSPAKVMCAFNLGRHEVVLQYCDEAERALQIDIQVESEATYYKRNAVAATRAAVLYHLGRYPEFSDAVNATLREAYATNNRSTLLQFAFTQTLVEELQDQPQLSRPRLDAQRNELPQRAFGVLHILHMGAVVHVAAVTRDYTWAQACLDTYWDQFIASIFNRGWFAELMRTRRIRLFLNRCVTGGDDASRWAEIDKDIRWLGKHAAENSARRASARLAYLEGDLQRAEQLYRQTSTTTDRVNGIGDATRDRYALGLVVGGQQGRELCASALSTLRELGIVNPIGAIHAVFPEFIGKEPK